METVTCNKLALNNFDGKRISRDNQISTLPYGHYLLNQTSSE